MRDALPTGRRYRCRGTAFMLAASVFVLTVPASGEEVQVIGEGGRHHEIWEEGSARERPDRYGSNGRYDRDEHLHDRDNRKTRSHTARPEPRVEIIVDGLSTREPAQREAAGGEDGGPSICRQAHSMTWSTRNLPCPESQPAERSNVWSTTGN